MTVTAPQIGGQTEKVRHRLYYRNRMDLSQEWATFVSQQNVISVAEEQDELQAQATRLINSTAAALKQLHDHRRVHGQHAMVPMPPVENLAFWMELIIATTDC